MAVGLHDENMPLHPVEGIRMSAVAAGIKKVDRLDVVLFEICPEATVAGVYTLNAFCAAPVVVCKRHSAIHTPRYFLVNTGNANAGTGEKGEADTLTCCEALALETGVITSQVLPFSTGVIGEPLPFEKILAVMPKLQTELSAQPWLQAARGIMTTDTRPKAQSTQIALSNELVTITGVAKGAGMIKPNMATLLAYIFTDLEISQDSLQAMLSKACAKSFNRITVDGDTSTNDSCMLVSTGKSGVSFESLSDENQQLFIASLDNIFIQLAQGLVRDAEGASKFVNICVEAGANSNECLKVAYTVAESPLVKTALFASDPNWGRILAAVGRAGIAEMDIQAVKIWLDDVCIVTDGGVSQSYQEVLGQKVMDNDEITITISLGRGHSAENVWTCDLSYDYVKINAEYRT